MQTIYFSETDNGLDIVDGAYIALLFIKNILRQNRTHPPTIKHSNLAPSLYTCTRLRETKPARLLFPCLITSAKCLSF